MVVLLLLCLSEVSLPQNSNRSVKSVLKEQKEPHL